MNTNEIQMNTNEIQMNTNEIQMNTNEYKWNTTPKKWVPTPWAFLSAYSEGTIDFQWVTWEKYDVLVYFINPKEALSCGELIKTFNSSFFSS